MPILNPNDLTPKAEREQTIETALLDAPPDLPGVKCVRTITPLVMTVLQRTNNPYVTGKAGFEAAGISFLEDGNVQDPAQFAIRMMPFTAEVLICFMCTRDELKHYATKSDALQSAALDYMEGSTVEALAEATVFVSEQLGVIAKTRAVPSRDLEKPEAEGLNGEGANAPKKPVRIG